MREYDRKLPPEDALDMRELYASGDYTMGELAEMYNVAPTTAWRIIKGFSYKAVTGGEPVELPNGRRRIFENGRDGFHILTNEQVIEIRKNYIKLRMKGNRAPAIFNAFANKYNVSPLTITSVVYSQSWEHLPSVKEMRGEA